MKLLPIKFDKESDRIERLCDAMLAIDRMTFSVYRPSKVTSTDEVVVR